MTAINKYITFTLLFFSISVTLQAQAQKQLEKSNTTVSEPSTSGILTGKITDSETGEELIGVNVFILGTTLGASTDITGMYLISNIPQGIYDVKFSFIGYSIKKITETKIKNEKSTVINIMLSEETVAGQEVIITADIIRSGEGALLSERKRSASIGDAISSEQMRKTPDATSGDALKRLTGVTLVDNKFVFIRGVTDRYNQTTLNGASAPSTSIDKKSFSFDLLPSNLLDNMNVTKTATPDLPGDFTGGLVQIKTLDVPEKLSLKFVAGTSSNSLTTFKDFYRTQGGKTDWLGKDDGTRALPQQRLSNSELGKVLPNTWGTNLRKGFLGQSFSISSGNKFDFDDSQIGIIGAVSYRNNFQHSEIAVIEYGNRQLRRNISGFSDKASVLWGTVLDVSYQISDAHKIILKNNFNRSAEDNIYRMNGYNASDDENIRSYQSSWEERSMYSGQIGGDHVVQDLYGLRMDWMVFYSDALSQQPDRKELVYSVSPYVDQPYIAKPGERSWGTSYEKNLGEKINITIPVETGKLRVGALHEQRKKNYEMEFFQIQLSNPMNSYLTILPPDSIYRRENFSAGKFILHPFSESSGAYSGNQNLLAYYAMADFPFSIVGLDFRFAGGVRVERSSQNVSTYQGRLGASDIFSTVSNTDILPSANVTYMISERQNLRLAYGQTVNRPEFREMSELYFYDFDKSEYVHGNSSIKRALIQNYDIRYEIFPSFTDLFAVSYFYKALTNPIEEFRTFTSFTERTWRNAVTGKNYGWEFEVRKNLFFLGEYFSGSAIVANYTRIISSIPFRENKGNSIVPEIIEGLRPMQGQSPYMYNISVYFMEPTIGTTFNVLYNEYGSRIDAIGDIRAGDGDVYEQKRGTVDLTITQPLSMLAKGFEAKFSTKNLNQKPIVFTQGKEVHRKHNVGVSYSLQFSYSFQ